MSKSHRMALLGLAMLLVAIPIWTQNSGVVEVRQFGATADGKTDDSGAIAAAIDSFPAVNGGIVSFSPGTYFITHPIVPLRNSA